MGSPPSRPSLHRDLERLVRAVAPHLRTGIPAGDHSTERYTSWSVEELVPGGSRVYSEDTRLTVVLSSGERAYLALDERIARTVPARLYWGEVNLRDMTHRALEAVAKGAQSVEAADALITELDADPPRSLLMFRVQGIAPFPEVHAAGVTFCYRDPKLIAGLVERSSAEVKEALELDVVNNRDGVAITLSVGDYARGPLNARERIMVGMCVLGCVRANAPHVSGEADFGFGDTEWGDVVVIEPGAAAWHLSPQDLDHRRLWSSDEVVREELDRRPGLRQLDDLGRALPLDPDQATDLDMRLARACAMVASSFNGSPAERVLKRWVAIESLVGDIDGELSERLADRLAVLTSPPEERAGRKRRIKHLYRYRNDVAHGRVVRDVPEDEAGEIRALAIAALEAVAELRALATDEALATAFERARYEALDLRDLIP